jgi:tripartite-type tricarboxylate transporter receptor subunit TctC
MKSLFKATMHALLGVLLVGVGVLSAPQGALAWEPIKPIDFVIMAGKGGGADKMARLMQTIVEKHKLSSKPLIPINKPGGSGAESLIYLKNRSGVDRDHTIMVTLNSFYTTPLRQPDLQVDITKFAPIGRMAEDTFLLWVHKDSGIKNIDDFVKAAKAKGSNWIMAGTGKGQEDQLLTSFLNSAYGLKMKYVPFKGGGRVAKELAGKHADSTVNNPSEQLGFYEAGQTVPIAACRRCAGYEQEGAEVLPGAFRKGIQNIRVAAVHEEKEPAGRLPQWQGTHELLEEREASARQDAEGYRRNLIKPVQ